MTNEEQMKIYDQYVCAALISICSSVGLADSDVLRADRVAIAMMGNRESNLMELDSNGAIEVPKKTIFENL